MIFLLRMIGITEYKRIYIYIYYYTRKGISIQVNTLVYK